MRKEGIEVYRGVRILKDGSFKVRIEQSEFRGRGWFNLEISDGRIKFVKYDTRDSPFHAMTSSPAHTLLQTPLRKRSSWEEEGESNWFTLESRSRIIAINEKIIVPAGKFRCLKVETDFEIPERYTGPPYLRKRHWFAKGVGIVRLEVDYRRGEKDMAFLEKYQGSGQGYWPLGAGNNWTYLWTCQWGPNKFNIHNTRQEEKYKPPKP